MKLSINLFGQRKLPAAHYISIFAVRQKRNENGMVAVTGEVKFLTESALKSVPGLLKPKNELAIGKSIRLLAKIINAH